MQKASVTQIQAITFGAAAGATQSATQGNVNSAGQIQQTAVSGTEQAANRVKSGANAPPKTLQSVAQRGAGGEATATPSPTSTSTTATPTTTSAQPATTSTQTPTTTSTTAPPSTTANATTSVTTTPTTTANATTTTTPNATATPTTTPNVTTTPNATTTTTTAPPTAPLSANLSCTRITANATQPDDYRMQALLVNASNPQSGVLVTQNISAGDFQPAADGNVTWTNSTANLGVPGYVFVNATFFDSNNQTSRPCSKTTCRGVSDR
ncbi:hypothetical protein [Haladaptatus sp. R4]|uniref:hypothetical protein n=1 Tax=Haladaptatus sp. R4 TaxID=1679489 RepID=UPI001CBF85A9|nr:hypothetical protein [Haladaptatus sp. R4]